MFSKALMHDGANLVEVFPANFSQDASADPIAIIAGATPDGVKTTGLTIDRQDLMGGIVRLQGNAVLADTKSVSFAIERQESDDGSTWDTAVAIAAATIAVTSDGGTTEALHMAVKEDLAALKRYVRYNVTPVMSNTATDTCIFHVQLVAVLGQGVVASLGITDAWAVVS